MSAGNIVKSLCEFFVYKSPPRVGNFFPLPNDIFNLDLCAGEIALYSFLMRMEDRKTYSCYPSFKTIGNDSVESLKTLEDSLQNWLQVFKFPAVERTTYDRAESIAKNQIYPQLGKKVVGDITAADIKKLLNYRNAFNAVNRLCDLDSSAAFFFCFIFHVVFALYFLTSSALICSIVNSPLTHCEDNRFVSSDTGTPSMLLMAYAVFSARLRLAIPVAVIKANSSFGFIVLNPQ